MANDSSGIPENEMHRGDDSLEFLLLGGELFPPGGGQGVVAGAAVVLGLPPVGLDVTVEREALQGGVEGAFAHLEDGFGQVTDALGDAVAGVGPADQGP